MKSKKIYEWIGWIAPSALDPNRVRTSCWIWVRCVCLVWKSYIKVRFWPFFWYNDRFLRLPLFFLSSYSFCFFYDRIFLFLTRKLQTHQISLLTEMDYFYLQKKKLKLMIFCSLLFFRTIMYTIFFFWIKN